MTELLRPFRICRAVMLVVLLWPASSIPKTCEADPGAAKGPADCRLMINWDQRNIFALQLTYVHRHQEPEAEAVKTMIEQIIDEHARAKIDRIVQCVFALPKGTVPAGFQSFERDVMSEKLYEDVPCGLETLEAAGYDLVQVLLDRSRENGVEFLGGLRMNDRHSLTTNFHAAHPEWQLPEYAGGMDYSHAGVRDTVLNFIDEFLERYDVDGLELDWMRWCHVFRPAEAEQNAPLLNDFVTQVRRRLDRSAEKRGRGRLLLGVRVPQTLDGCRRLGYDVAAWIRSGAVDFVCPSDFFYTDYNTDVAAFVKLTEGTDVRIYPSLHPLISWGNDHQNHTRESYRAAAKSFLTFGAHGISAYNYQYHWRPDKGKESDWPGVLDYLTGVRDLDELGSGDRRYLFHPMWSGHGGGVGPSGEKRDIRILLGRDPAQREGSLSLRLAEDLKAPGARAWLEFKVTGLDGSDQLRVTLNGERLTDRSFVKTRDADGQTAREGRVLPAFSRFRFPLKSSDLVIGENRLTVTLEESAGAEAVVVQEVEILVQVPKLPSNPK